MMYSLSGCAEARRHAPRECWREALRTSISSTGAQLLQSNTLSDSLHSILDYMAHARWVRRVKSDCPDALKHFWSGHAPRHVSERYTKLTQDRDFRLMWSEKVGLGFELPGAKVGQLVQFRKVG